MYVDANQFSAKVKDSLTSFPVAFDCAVYSFLETPSYTY